MNCWFFVTSWLNSSMMLMMSAEMLQMKKMRTTTRSITARLCSRFSWLDSKARVALACKMKTYRLSLEKRTLYGI